MVELAFTVKVGSIAFVEAARMVMLVSQLFAAAAVVISARRCLRGLPNQPVVLKGI